MQKILLAFLGLGGVINGLASFTGNVTPTLGIELLWIANDLTLLLGLIGLLLLQQTQLKVLGKSGLLIAIIAFAFIAGPSTTVGGIAPYTIGAPLIALGLLIYGSDNFFTRPNRRWVSALLVATLLLNVAAGLLNNTNVAVITGLLFSLAIVILAVDSLNTIKAIGSH